MTAPAQDAPAPDGAASPQAADGWTAVETVPAAPSFRTTPYWSERATMQIDLVRGAAALAVFGCHLRDSWCVPYAEVPDPSRLLQMTYLATAFAHQAVVVFFVLSGMLVGGGVVAAVQTDRWSVRHYVRQRATRLYVVLAPALVMTAVWDFVGRAAPGDAGYVEGRSSFGVFAGNLAFLQGTFVPSFGSNNPLWSLANEACYYAVFPLVFIPLWHRSGWPFAAVGLTVLLACSALNDTMLGGFGFWLLGVGAWCLPLSGWMTHRLAPLLGAGALAASLAVSVAAVLPPGFGADSCVALGTTALLLTIRAQRGAAKAAVARFAKALSGCSYTLYVVHMPLIACFVAWGLTDGRVLPTPAVALQLAVHALLITGYAYAMAQVTEARTDLVRRWITRR